MKLQKSLLIFLDFLDSHLTIFRNWQISQGQQWQRMSILPQYVSPFLRSQLFKTFLLWFLYKALSQLLLYVLQLLYCFPSKGSPENKILYHSSRKKNQYISNSLSGSNKMIYVFLLYPLIDYEFLIGKDSDSLSLMFRGLRQSQMSVTSLISYFSPK